MNWRLHRFQLRWKDRPGVREGLVLRVEEDGVQGLGEASPLPGLHTESLAEVADQITDAMRHIAEHWPAGHGVGSLGLPPFHALPSLRRASPLAAFAIDSALWDLFARRAGLARAKLHRRDAPDRVLINGLVAGPPAHAAERARSLVAAGVRTIKIKVARGDDLERVQAVRAAVGPEVRLRLDANRGWELCDAVAFARACGPVELIEEPVADPADLAEFCRRTGTPVALDESARRADLARLLAIPEVRALVLKPSVLGLRRSVALADLARSHGVLPVVSATFESAVGLGALVHLAAALGDGATPHGLGTGAWLAEDLAPSPPIVDGSMSLPEPIDVEFAP